MKTIVVATDFSERSEIALERAGVVAAATGADLLVVHAIDDSLPPPILDRRVEEAEEALRGRTAAFAGQSLRWEVAVGDVFWALHRAATKAHADLIVAGDHRRSPLRDLFRDTTVERLIRVSAVPVLIARSAVTPAYHHAVVGVESEEGGELVDALADLGAAAPAKATVLHAVSNPAEGLMYYAGVDKEAMEDYRASVARQARSRLSAALATDRIPIDIRIVDAAPATAIAGFAKDAGSDLVVVSSHARRAMARGILGSVSSGLIRHGATDLLIVPRVVTERRHP